jgi:hypothetical protein
VRRLTPILCACLVAAGCGSTRSAAPPRQAKLPRAVAARLAGESDAVAAALAAGDPCGAQRLASRLRADATAEIARIPARYREPLSSGVNEVVADVPACAPPVTVTVAPTPSPPPPHDNGHGEDNGHGKGHGHGDH